MHVANPLHTGLVDFSFDARLLEPYFRLFSLKFLHNDDMAPIPVLSF